jgi:membrane carboxypeptidase/penicillin-binding protein
MIKKRPLKTRYSKKRKYVKKTKKTKNILKIIIKIIIFIIISLIILSFVLYNKYLKDLPSVKELESLNLSQASTIYDNS